MSEMTISINSRPFQVMCRDGEEAQVTQLAEDLATRVAEIKKLNERGGDSHLLVLAALTLCSEIRDMKREIEAIRLDVAKAGSARETLGEKMGDMEDALVAALELAAQKVEDMMPPHEDAAG
jgi:cell division protein ZapA